MERSVECTHCGVLMTSWSAPGSPIRYFQCPFCARTHSSLYGEVFRRRAGARVLDTPTRTSRPSEIPMASQEDARWARVKACASRWFARVEADERRHDRCSGEPDLPEIDPSEVIEIAPARATSARRR